METNTSKNVNVIADVEMEVNVTAQVNANVVVDVYGRNSPSVYSFSNHYQDYNKGLNNDTDYRIRFRDLFPVDQGYVHNIGNLRSRS